jgi:3-hydroxy-D-aspartate aldolase
VQIAALQIKLGHGLTSGFCCQKVVEAEALISAGLNDVLVSNQIVGATKIQVCR